MPFQVTHGMPRPDDRFPYRRPGLPPPRRHAMNQAALARQLDALADLLARGEAAGAAAQAAELHARFPHEAEPLRLRALALLQLQQFQAALDAVRAAQARAPRSLPVLCNLGSILLAAGDTKAAIDACHRALALEPDHAVALNGLGNACRAAGEHDAALVAYQRATAQMPGHVPAWLNLGALQFEAGQLDAAELAARRALALSPQHPDAWLLLGHVLGARGAEEEAMQVYAQAQRLAPADARPAYEFGLIAEQRKQLVLAVQAQARALQLDPTLHAALGQLVFLRRQLCDWTDLDGLSRALRERVAAGAGGIAPFGFLAEPASAAEQLQCARTAAAAIEARMAPLRRQLAPPPPRTDAVRLRVGLVSNGFGEHPTGLLCVALVEALRAQPVDTHLFATQADDGGPIRARLHAAARLHPCERLGPLALAQAIRAQALDVLIDLRGYGGGSVAATLALRPAPLQAAWFAYPGTSGAAWIDYLITDPVVLPASLRGQFSEAIAYLPRCFQPSDTTRVVGQPPPRTALGLPARGMVYACFNNSYKFNPDSLERLLAVLRGVPDAVLWLLGGPEGADARLREQARRRGVAPQRLVFQPRLPHAQYLALYRHADLFLDTRPYGAHTTASDAIWAGCPVLTVAGDTFAARVAASLNQHLGLPELNCADDDAFIARAIELGRNEDARTALRTRVAEQRTHADLFDMPALARDLVALLQRMVARQRSGLAPTDLDAAAPAYADHPAAAQEST